MNYRKAEKVRDPYNYDPDQETKDTGLKCLDKTRAQQQFRDESNINYIAERYGLTGEMPTVQDRPAYGDFTGIFNFQDAQNELIKARQAFMNLPAKLRTRFNNDPGQLLNFLDDPANRKEAEFLGLVNPPKEAPQSPTLHAGEPTAPDGRANPARPEKPSTGSPTTPTKDT